MNSYLDMFRLNPYQNTGLSPELQNFMANPTANASTGMSPLQQMQQAGMAKQPMTGYSPQQQASMVTGKPISNPTGMTAQQQTGAIGNLGSSGFSTEQLMSALMAADPTLFDAPDAPNPSMFGGGNVYMPQVAPQGKSNLGGLMQLLQQKGKDPAPQQSPNIDGEAMYENPFNFAGGLLDLFGKAKALF